MTHEQYESILGRIKFSFTPFSFSSSEFTICLKFRLKEKGPLVLSYRTLRTKLITIVNFIYVIIKINMIFRYT